MASRITWAFLSFFYLKFNNNMVPKIRWTTCIVLYDMEILYEENKISAYTEIAILYIPQVMPF